MLGSTAIVVIGLMALNMLSTKHRHAAVENGSGGA